MAILLTALRPHIWCSVWDDNCIQFYGALRNWWRRRRSDVRILKCVPSDGRQTDGNMHFVALAIERLNIESWEVPIFHWPFHLWHLKWFLAFFETFSLKKLRQKVFFVFTESCSVQCFNNWINIGLNFKVDALCLMLNFAVTLLMLCCLFFLLLHLLCASKIFLMKVSTALTPQSSEPYVERIRCSPFLRLPFFGCM